MNTNHLFRFTIVLLLSMGSTQFAFAQQSSVNVTGSVSVTNNGISIVPALSLDKPAAIFNLSVGNRFRFEPELRFSMEGEPWSFLFWFRYDLVKDEKFSLRVGAHPALSFNTTDATINQVTDNVITVRRFLAGEVSAGYRITDHWSVGSYYLFSHGVDPNVPDYTNYVSINSPISAIPLFGDVRVSLTPQIYYLKIDEIDGFYVASGIRLSKADFPVSLSSTINKTIDSEIENNDPLWNISLNYSFHF